MRPDYLNNANKYALSFCKENGLAETMTVAALENLSAMIQGLMDAAWGHGAGTVKSVGSSEEKS